MVQLYMELGWHASTNKASRFGVDSAGAFAAKVQRLVKKPDTRERCNLSLSAPAASVLSTVLFKPTCCSYCFEHVAKM
jgi:hypothetical protein